MVQSTHQAILLQWNQQLHLSNSAWMVVQSPHQTIGNTVLSFNETSNFIYNSAGSGGQCNLHIRQCCTWMVPEHCQQLSSQCWWWNWYIENQQLHQQHRKKCGGTIFTSHYTVATLTSVEQAISCSNNSAYSDGGAISVESNSTVIFNGTIYY